MGRGLLKFRPSKSPLKGDFPSHNYFQRETLYNKVFGMQDKKWQVADTTEYGLLKQNSKQNRRNQTEAESVFWQFAKSSGLGEKCRRQYAIGQYIVDFFFRKSMLIVELDGGYHNPTHSQIQVGQVQWFNDPEQVEKDILRQEWLERMGYRVVRFSNEEVLFETEKVINIVKQHLNP